MIYRFKHPDTGAITYPFAKEMLRSNFPNTSFPFPLTDSIAAEFGCLPVFTIERPPHDPRTQRLEEHDPEELEDGTLRQVLTVRDATEEEIAAWDEANKPAPNWPGFYQETTTDESINQALISLILKSPSLYGGLILGLDHVRQGSPDLLVKTIEILLQAEALDTGFIAILNAIALRNNIVLQLPQV